jgi:hypothetical protein
MFMTNTVESTSRNQQANPEEFDEQVSVQIDRFWSETSYTSFIGGAVLLALGVALLLFANRRQLGDFHRALEHQD